MFMKILKIIIKKRENKVLIIFDDMIADIEHNKEFNRKIKELFYRGRKINISIAFITQCYFKVLKDARLNRTLVIKKNYEVLLKNNQEMSIIKNF